MAWGCKRERERERDKERERERERERETDMCKQRNEEHLYHKSLRSSNFVGISEPRRCYIGWAPTPNIKFM